MADIEMWVGMVPGSASSTGGSPVVKTGSNRVDAGGSQRMHAIHAEFDELNSAMCVDNETAIQNHSSPGSWRSVLLNDTLGLAPSNTPIQSPTRTKVTNSILSSPGSPYKRIPCSDKQGEDLQPKVLFATTVESQSTSYKKPNTVSELLKSVRYDEHFIQTGAAAAAGLNNSSPLTPRRRTTINTSMVSNYTHQCNMSTTTSFEYTLNESFAQNTPFTDPQFTTKSFTFSGPSKITVGKRSNSTPFIENPNKQINVNESPGSNQLTGAAMLDYDLASEVISNGKLTLSSSPLPKFESRFPEPRLITDLFGLDENDIESETSEKKETIIELKAPNLPSGEISPSRPTTPSNEQDNNAGKQEKNPHENVNLLLSCEETSYSYERPQLGRYSNVRERISPRRLRPFRLEVDPENILDSGNRHGRLLRTPYLKHPPSYVEDDDTCEKQEYTPPAPRKYTPRSTAYVKQSKHPISGSRSRNGCWTCRIRKKKCSEETPFCGQCTRLGLRCDGNSEEKPAFMATPELQRKRLDEIKAHTSLLKKVGVAKRKREA